MRLLPSIHDRAELNAKQIWQSFEWVRQGHSRVAYRVLWTMLHDAQMMLPLIMFCLQNGVVLPKSEQIES